MNGSQPRKRAFGQSRSWRTVFTLTIAAALLSLSSLATQAASNWKVLKIIPVKGDGNWDYAVVDKTARRLYVAHGDQVDVLNVDTDNLVGQIPDTPGVHGIALVPGTHRAFISEGSTDHVAMVDTDTLRILRQIPAGKKPDAILYDPATRRVFVNNGDGNSTTAIDAATGDIVGTLDLGGAPEFAAADGEGHVYINLEEQSETLAIDSHNLKIEHRWPVSRCKAPSSMAIDQQARRLFIGCRSRVMVVMNIETGKVVSTLPIGDHVDATVYDPDRHLIFCSNRDGSLNIFRESSAGQYSSVQTVETAPGARTMALDAATQKLFLPTADLDTSIALKPGQKPPVKPGTFRLIVVGN